jgi:hypothetical protein
MVEEVCRQEALVQAVRSTAHHPLFAFPECTKRNPTLIWANEDTVQMQPYQWTPHERVERHRPCIAPQNPLAAVDAQRFSILNTFVPHTGQTP